MNLKHFLLLMPHGRILEQMRIYRHGISMGELIRKTKLFEENIMITFLLHTSLKKKKKKDDLIKGNKIAIKKKEGILHHKNLYLFFITKHL